MLDLTKQHFMIKWLCTNLSASTSGYSRRVVYKNIFLSLYGLI